MFDDILKFKKIKHDDRSRSKFKAVADLARFTCLESFEKTYKYDLHSGLFQTYYDNIVRENGRLYYRSLDTMLRNKLFISDFDIEDLEESIGELADSINDFHRFTVNDTLLLSDAEFRTLSNVFFYTNKYSLNKHINPIVKKLKLHCDKNAELPILEIYLDRFLRKFITNQFVTDHVYFFHLLLKEREKQLNAVEPVMVYEEEVDRSLFAKMSSSLSNTGDSVARSYASSMCVGFLSFITWGMIDVANGKRSLYSIMLLLAVAYLFIQYGFLREDSLF